ncbi:haloacid dehalogenase [Lysobacter sp. HDW10]|uniref:haloacid dehalogenase-like hydrolase n=1 Tax=Lysobacter sp. HDW10 TaxID=2714936 RepID=UPI00140B0E6D|nr:haloacid dehalogenase-like hydrolase [Lysobacter sp. HDW10]QIK80445.1 haloacid dehalogenase [Lysobacter sp. HDW10]
MSSAANKFIVFDFDHTLYDGDSGSHLYLWLIRRSVWRSLLALLILPIAAPLIAFMPTRRAGISAFVWVGSLGLHSIEQYNRRIDDYVLAHKADIDKRILPIAFRVLKTHLEAGDEVVIATGAPPELASAIFRFVEHTPVRVIGTVMKPFWGGMVAGEHCHFNNKMTMLRAAGFNREIDSAYSDSRADLPLLLAAKSPVVVNPNTRAVADFKRLLGAETPILNWGCKDRAGTPVA